MPAGVTPDAGTPQKAIRTRKWGWQCRYRPGSRVDDLVAYGVANQIADRMQVQLHHEVGAVRLSRLEAHAQDGSDFLVGFALRHKLSNLPFPRAQCGPLVARGFRGGRAAQKAAEQ